MAGYEDANDSNQLRHDPIFKMACDLPLLNPEIVQAWAEQLQNLRPDQLALIPHQPQG